METTESKQRKGDRRTYEINRSLLTGFFPFPFGVSTHICHPHEICARHRERSERFRAGGEVASRDSGDDTIASDVMDFEMDGSICI